MLCRKRLHRRQGAGELLQRAGDREARSRRGECDVSEPTELRLGTRVAGTNAHILYKTIFLFDFPKHTEYCVFLRL